ncbi:MAG: hypothetical protein H6739_18905 [Alphaproteobacteria bacterium]|nr:hypothetical protein [Alphaproteobacteria bacterium]
MILALLFACHGQNPADAPGPPPVPPPAPAPGPPGVPAGPGTAPPPPPPLQDPIAEPGGVVSAWSSTACHDRQYERRITLNPDFTYVGEDLVSPCPPNARCVWSGIVHFTGTWAQTGATDPVTLTEEKTLDGDKGQPRPTELRWTDDGLLVEPHEAGPCVYAKVVKPEPPPPAAP